MTGPVVRNDVSVTGAPNGGSAIHDLGYRRYEGSRLGPSGAWSAVYSQGLRAMFGLGRPFKAKVVPVLVVVATMLPVMGSLVASSASNGQLPIRYGQLISGQLMLFVLFLAAQTPEVLSRDQQHQLLPLLFTRDVTRQSYAMARFAAVFTAAFLVALAPLMLLYLGEIGIATDPAAGFRATGARIWPVLAQASLSAMAMTGIVVALAVWSSRRAYATASIFGAFLLLAAIAGGLDDLTGLSMRAAELLDPIRALRTMAMLLFGETTRGMELDPPMQLSVYVAIMPGIGVTGLLLLSWRMRRIHT